MKYLINVEDSFNDALWNAWLNTVVDYEQNVLTNGVYPEDHSIISLQKKQRYNFLLPDPYKHILEFESEQDFLCFMLKWG